ncbi:hypothetical protein H6F43_18300 [Leptolyngbya sp. FACHB-36]|uniref:hypothetical protein n=1 Tax=Leptolyngbya sp. FACHB-36 TaxID=2692808 RepID=UPI001680ADED|nr:hypothetical protein [Leptolyngbya sp. FACHB-36]MBD2022134.1 hypothetical protein [Leptolyngbya sp. FACHB-36]
MHQYSRADGSIQSAPNHRLDDGSAPVESIHPVLHTALANLDVQLEDELARYRRQRISGRSTPAKRRTASPVPEQVSLPSTASPAVPQARSTPAVAEPSAWDDPAPSLAIATASERALTPEPPTLSDDLFTPESRQNALVRTAPELDDYLESSEELLRSLAAEEAQVQAERGFMQSLLTPLGVGSMLLLLLSSALFGYVVMNPTGISRLFASDKSNSASTSQTPNDTPQLDGSTIAPQPNLAAQEFKDLNLSTLSTLNPGKASPAAMPSPRPSVAPASRPVPPAPTTSAPATSSAPQLAPPEPVAPAPAPVSSYSTRSAAPAPSYPTRSAAPVPPAPRVTAAPAPVERSVAVPRSLPPAAPTTSAAPRSAPPGGYPVKVEIPFDGDNTLGVVQKVVPDAYVRSASDGRAVIQGGAFGTPAEAEARAAELRKQGISAEVKQR